MQRALSVFSGAAASCADLGPGGHHNQLATAAPCPGIPTPTEPVSGSGRLLAIDGWIDEIDGGGIAPEDASHRYLALLASNGDNCERRVSGCYASACWEPGGVLRLARSPWRSPPLHYAQSPHGPAAASVVRVLFALGVDRRFDRDRLLHALWLDGAYEGRNDWYEGIRSVPSGSVVRLFPDGRTQTEAWYDPHAIAPCLSTDPDEWIAQGRTLLARAGSHAARVAQRPAAALSAGLDSPLATSALVDGGARPLTLTLVPNRHAKAVPPPGSFLEEADAARAFAEQRGLIHREVEMEGWDEGLREFFQRTDMATPFIANASAQIAIARAAKDQGSDWLFDATIGNDTISASGHWAYAEYLKRGKWREMVRALQARPDDSRSLARKVAALALAPLFGGLADPIRKSLTRAAPFYSSASFLRREVAASHDLANRAASLAGGDPPAPASRHALIEFAFAASDAGQGDFDLGLEQMTGVRRRDVLAYRPLIEFALSLPSEAFLRRGADRWLARELARGIVPEPQRTNRRMGAHHADRHHRMTRALPELTAWAERLGDHPVLGELVDTERLRTALGHWPKDAPEDPAVRYALHHGVPNVVALGRFVGHVEQRNDL